MLGFMEVSIVIPFPGISRLCSQQQHMKKSFFYISILLVTLLSSCEKDEGKLPAISFKTGTGYTFADMTVAKNTTVLVGIDAAKTEDKDVLKTFDASRAYDTGALSSFINESLSGAQGDNYSRDISITTRNQDGTEKYVFTVINRDGLVNSVTLTLTVQ